VSKVTCLYEVQMTCSTSWLLRI